MCKSLNRGTQHDVVVYPLIPKHNDYEPTDIAAFRHIYRNYRRTAQTYTIIARIYGFLLDIPKYVEQKIDVGGKLLLFSTVLFVTAVAVDSVDFLLAPLPNPPNHWENSGQNSNIKEML